MHDKKQSLKEVRNLVLQSLARHEAVISDEHILIPHEKVPSSLGNLLHQAGKTHDNHSTLLVIGMFGLGNEQELKEIRRYIPQAEQERQKITTQFTRRKSLAADGDDDDDVPWRDDEPPLTTKPVVQREKDWWKHESVLALAKTLPTYCMPLDPVEDADKIKKINHEFSKNRILRDPEEFLKDEAELRNYNVDADKLKRAISDIKEMCEDMGIPLPDIKVELSGPSCSADYQRININIKSLNVLSPRALRAELAHELGHIVPNHAILFHEHMKPNRKDTISQVERQMERDADYLGIVIGKDPEGFAQAMRQHAAHNIAKAESKEQRPDGLGQTPLILARRGLREYAGGDNHPTYIARMRLCSEMEQDRRQSQLTMRR